MQNCNEVEKLDEVKRMVEGFPVKPEVKMSKDPEVIFLAVEDWANAAFNFAKSLQAVGVNAIALSKKPVVLYTEQAKIYFNQENELYPVCSKAKWVIWMHSQMTALPDVVMNNRSIKFGVFHGGTQYRTQSEVMNRIFNDRVDLCFIQTLEMWDLGAKEPKHQLIPPVDTDFIQPAYETMTPWVKDQKLVIAHYPRNAQVKGSEGINGVIEKLKKENPEFNFDYKYSDEVVGWEDNLKRIADCDIYIEQTGTGYWSVTAMEAAAMGKVVIAPFDHQEIYKKQYGEHSIKVAQTLPHLEEILKEVLSSNITNEKMKTRKWIETNHSYHATGSRIKKLLNL